MDKGHVIQPQVTPFTELVVILCSAKSERICRKSVSEF